MDAPASPMQRRVPAGESRAAASYQSVLRFYLPLCFTSVANMSTNSIVNAGLARTADPTIALAAYGVARGVLSMIDSFLQTVRPAAVALIRDDRSYRMVRVVVALQALFMTLGIAATAFTPLGDWLFVTVLGVAPPVARGARLAMAVFVPMPACMAWRCFQQGLLIAHKVTTHVLLGALSRPILCAALIFGLVALGDGLPGVVAGAVALVAVIFAEGVILRFVIDRRGYAWSRVFRTGDPGPATSYRAVLMFLLPLFLQTYLKTVTQPILDGAMARGLNPTVSLAVFALSWQFARLFVGPAQMVHQASLVLGREAEARRVVYRASVGIGLGLSACLFALSATHGAGLLFRVLFALPQDLAPLAEQVLLTLSPVPLIIAWREYYWGLLLQGGRTGLIGTGKTLGVGVTVVAAAVGVLYVPLAGAVVAGLAMTAGELVESAVVVWYARRSPAVRQAAAA